MFEQEKSQCGSSCYRPPRSHKTDYAQPRNIVNSILYTSEIPLVFSRTLDTIMAIDVEEGGIT